MSSVKVRNTTKGAFLITVVTGEDDGKPILKTVNIPQNSGTGYVEIDSEFWDAACEIQVTGKGFDLEEVAIEGVKFGENKKDDITHFIKVPNGQVIKFGYVENLIKNRYLALIEDDVTTSRELDMIAEIKDTFGIQIADDITTAQLEALYTKLVGKPLPEVDEVLTPAKTVKKVIAQK